MTPAQAKVLTFSLDDFARQRAQARSEEARQTFRAVINSDSKLRARLRDSAANVLNQKSLACDHNLQLCNEDCCQIVSEAILSAMFSHD